MAEADVPDKFWPAIRFVVNNLVWMLALVGIEQAVTGEFERAAIIGVIFTIDLMVAVKWGLLEAVAGKFKGMTGAQLTLMVGIIGAWAFLTLCLGSGAWMIWTGQGLAAPSAAQPTEATDPGPIRWNVWFSIEGNLSVRIFSLRFSGGNISKTQSLRLKEANIISAIDGTLLPLEISAVNDAGDFKIVSLDKVQLIPPGARVELVAKFGDPDPNVPGNVLGMEPKPFLEKWRQFSFNVTDDVRTYRVDFDDRAMMGFFQGKIGPRVTLKPGAG
jgi:hypothetical protein